MARIYVDINSIHTYIHIYKEKERERERVREEKIVVYHSRQIYKQIEMESEMRESRFKRICVFCGSSQGKKSSYQDAAVQLGNELVHILI